MKEINSICLFVLLSCFTIQTSYSSLGDFMTNFNFVKNMIAKVDDMKKEVNGEEGEEFKGDIFGDRTSSILDGLLARTDKITKTLSTINGRMSRKLEQLEKLMQSIGDDGKKSALMNEFSRSVDRINYAYAKLVQFSTEKKISSERIDKFIEDNIESQGSDGVEGHLQTIYSVIVSPSNPDNLLSMMERIERNKYAETSCGRTTPIVLLWEFYLTVSGVELLGLQTLVTGYLLREARNPNKTSDDEIDFVESEQLRRMVDYVDKFSPALKRLSNKFRNCDPPPGQDIRDKTFYEMWGSLQLIILTSYNLWKKTDSCSQWQCPNHNGDTPQNDRCWVGTHSRTEWQEDGTPADYNLCTSPRACRGTLQKCEGMQDVTYCMKPNSTRRYEWFHRITDNYGDDANEFYGKKTDCADGYSETLKYFNDDSGQYRCRYCLCECYDNAPDSVSVNTISFLESRANTSDNRVVIGVRFRISENILHVQVKEGKITPGYTILPGKTRWVRLPKIKEDIDINRADPEKDKMAMNVDYAVLDMSQAINFDEIKLPYGRLITAVRLGGVKIFSDDEDEDIEMPRRIRLLVESMEYDYKTGLLKPETAEWIRPPAAQHDIKYRPYRALPTVRKNYTKVSPITDKMFMQFDRTYDGEDAGQSVVPFLDAQDFEALPNMPISGLGIHHRGIYKPGDDDYSGFVGFHGYTYEIGEFLSESFREYAETQGISQPDKKEDSKKSQQEDEYADSGDYDY